jgi:hypothetical protein
MSNCLCKSDNQNSPDVLQKFIRSVAGVELAAGALERAPIVRSLKIKSTTSPILILNDRLCSSRTLS